MFFLFVFVFFVDVFFNIIACFVGLQADWVALDEPALGDITGVSGGLERAQVLLVGSRSEVVHDAKDFGKEQRKTMSI